jgi:hypothetical protein
MHKRKRLDMDSFLDLRFPFAFAFQTLFILPLYKPLASTQLKDQLSSSMFGKEIDLKPRISDLRA